MADGNRNAGICVGLDIGYGNLKVVASALGSDEVRTIVLPVGAAPKAKAMKSMSGRVDPGEGELVMIDGEEWVAGVSPLELQDFARQTHGNYPKTKEYLALYYAALAKLGHPKIAALVTGLPVSQFYEGKQSGLTAEICKRLGGQHFINPIPGGKMAEVDVGRVLVVPQPAGAYTDMVTQDPDLAHDKDRFALVLDVGYFSTDWVLIQGGKVSDGSSGSSTDATSRILEDAAGQIKAARGIPVSPARLESAFRNGRVTLQLGEHTVDYRTFINAAATEVADRVMAKVGSSLRGQVDLIDVVAITGGGGAMFERSVRKAFPSSMTALGKDPIVANARGFMQLAKSLAQTAQK